MVSNKDWKGKHVTQSPGEAILLLDDTPCRNVTAHSVTHTEHGVRINLTIRGLSQNILDQVTQGQSPTPETRFKVLSTEELQTTPLLVQLHTTTMDLRQAAQSTALVNLHNLTIQSDTSKRKRSEPKPAKTKGNSPSPLMHSSEPKYPPGFPPLHSYEDTGIFESCIPSASQVLNPHMYDHNLLDPVHHVQPWMQDMNTLYTQQNCTLQAENAALKTEVHDLNKRILEEHNEHLQFKLDTNNRMQEFERRMEHVLEDYRRTQGQITLCHQHIQAMEQRLIHSEQLRSINSTLTDRRTPNQLPTTMPYTQGWGGPPPL
jgi:hypothetical protein